MREGRLTVEKEEDQWMETGSRTRILNEYFVSVFVKEEHAAKISLELGEVEIIEGEM